MKYGYYPGCSLEKNAIAYQKSTMAAIKPFNLDLDEIEDWNCCGATEYIAINLVGAYSLVARNLALAAQQSSNWEKQDGRYQVVAPCSACYLNLSKAETYLEQTPKLMEQVNIALAEGNMHYQAGSLRIRHLLDIIVNDIGFENVAAKVTKPLKGLRIAPYYGCLIVRPGFQAVFDDPEHPTLMDKLMRTLGATVVDFPLKASCCGGHMTQISRTVALDMIYRLVRNAADYNADVIVTICPMCQLNLDAYQGDASKMYGTNLNIPVLYFTQLMGLAFGVPPDQLGLGKEFVDARPALSKIGVEIPEEPPKKKRPSKEELPMPHMMQEG